jgi:LacI family transcriptional regulator
VINDHPNVSERTRRRVRRVIDEQGFRPNLAARALVTQRTKILSVVIPQALSATFTDPYFPALLQSITVEANRCDYAVMLWVGNNAGEEDRFADRILNHTLFDGVLVASAVDGDPILHRLAEAGFPFVLIGPGQLDSLNNVDVDNRHGAYLAVSHLIRLGYQRIGTITGPLNMGAARDRLNGYRMALQEAGRPFDETLLVEGNFDEASGYRAMQILLECGVDAVFAASDIMAQGALYALNDCGRRVPGDVALVGYDDLPLATSMLPALTTVRQPIAQLGTLATQTLIGLLNETLTVPHSVLLAAELVIRDSCGAKIRS